MSVPASLGGTVSTIRVSPAGIPIGHHEALKASYTVAPGSRAAFTVKQQCSVYYGQKKASTLPAAFGKTLPPCSASAASSHRSCRSWASAVTPTTWPAVWVTTP
jgi:hypothetical protein